MKLAEVVDPGMMTEAWISMPNTTPHPMKSDIRWLCSTEAEAEKLVASLSEAMLAMFNDFQVVHMETLNGFHLVIFVRDYWIEVEEEGHFYIAFALSKEACESATQKLITADKTPGVGDMSDVMISPIKLSDKRMLTRVLTFLRLGVREVPK